MESSHIMHKIIIKFHENKNANWCQKP